MGSPQEAERYMSNFIKFTVPGDAGQSTELIDVDLISRVTLDEAEISATVTLFFTNGQQEVFTWKDKDMGIELFDELWQQLR